MRRARWQVLAIILGMLLSQVTPGISFLPLDRIGPIAAHAAGTWYVDQNGAGASDSNSCTSSSSPCKTIGGALGKAFSGNTININPGTYNECLNLNQNLTLSGAGAATTIVDGTGCGTVITVASGSTASISGLTIQNGSTSFGGAGGGIASTGSLTLDHVVVQNNSASYDGGGIDQQNGSLTINSSTIANNAVTYFNGGGLRASKASVTIQNSTFTGNKSGNTTRTWDGDGGAIFADSGTTLSISNSTLSGNVAGRAGGGIALRDTGTTVNLDHTTISNNTANGNNPGGASTGGGGGGIISYSLTGFGTVNIKNTIVAGNTANNDTPSCPNLNAGVTSQGYNLADDTSCSSGFGSSDVLGASPNLGSLADNGGPTQTQAPSDDSRAIGVGTCTDLLGNAVKTDQRGFKRPLSGCTIGAYEADQGNNTWANALTLNQTSGTYQVNQTVSQHIYVPTQERWYKFAVTPGSQIHISVQGDPGTIVSLHSDMQAEYNSLATPTNAAVQSARDAGTGFLPQGFLPQGFLPQGFLPQGFLPQGFLPQGFLPQGFLPQGFLPQGFLPQGFLPQGFLPQGFLPQGFLPGPYSGATRASLLAISATPGSNVQTIDRNTWSNFGYFYVRVVGPADRTSPFTISVTETGGVCANISPISATPPSPTNIPTGLKSLILWDPSRISGSGADINSLGTKLSQFAQRPEVQGTVVDLSQIPGIDGNGSAQQQSDNNAACPPAKNIVANDIKSVIQAYRAQNPGLQYIVLIGDDHSIPFFRYPDVAGLAPESQYFPPVADTSASQAGLRDNFVLGQDEYGASVDLPRGDHSLPVPDLAVGRLVSTASEVSHMLDVYTAANGTITPRSSLVTGYDFVADAASNAQTELAAGTNSTPDSLIQPQGTSPSGSPDPPTWTATDLRQKLLGSQHDIVFLAGHFSAGGLLASDYVSQLAASDVAASNANLTNTLFLVLGCHGGYNIPGGDTVQGISPSPDWPEALAAKGATLLAATGYAYGDTVLTEYGEHLFDNYVHQLRMGTGIVTVGQAEVAAKKEYLASHADLAGIDEKTLLETTLYGLPMFGVNMPGQRVTPPSSSSIVSGTQTVSSGPGKALNLSMGQSSSNSSIVDIQPAVQSHTVSLTNTADNSTINATYLSGRDGTVAHPLDPISPLQLDDVHVNGQILRGVGFRGGTYKDLPGITPLTDAPATENSVGHPGFFSTVLYPTQTWTANYLDAVSGGDERLVTTPAQYVSSNNADGSLSTNGTLREFTDMQFRLYYLPSDWTTNPTIAQAAVGTATNIASVSATANSGQVTFSVRALSNPAIGTQDVWVTYTDPSAPGTWTSIDLTQPNPSGDPTLWQATAALPNDILFMVQAANGTGLVSLATNSGAFYTLGSATPPTQAQTSITLQSPPNAGSYQQSSTLQVQLTSNGTPVQDQQVMLQLGGQAFFKNTDSTGAATFTVPLDQPPGSYSLSASFAGSTTLAASQTSSESFQINPGSTVLTFTTASATAVYGQPVGIGAALTDAAGHPLAQRSVLFTATGTGQTFQKSVITDYAGRAQLGGIGIPAGTYSVSASYGGQIANGQVQESDPNYQSTQANGTASLVVQQAPQTITFGPLANHLLGDPPLNVSATGGNSGNPITFTAGPSNICTAGGTNGAIITLAGVGTCTVTASQVGNQNYLAATSVSQSFTVSYPPLYLALTLTQNPPGPVTTGSVLTASFTLGNHTTQTQTVNVRVNFTFMGSSARILGSSAFDLTLKPGQSLGKTVSFTVQSWFPRGTYALSVTAKDGSGHTASSSISLTVT